MEKIQREHNRVIPASSLKVYENSTFIGYLIDISENGIMILSSSPIPQGKNYNFTVEVAKHGLHPERVDTSCDFPFVFSAECRWTRKDDADKDCYLSGFAVTEISREQRLSVEALIRHGHLE